MKEPLISVIVPVYKVEKYLSACIQSLLAQTYLNYEVLLIDDGSPDNCGEICEAYAKKNPKIRCFHKENGGQADARNFGVGLAKGEYILFVDSDDYVHEDYIAYLWQIKNEFDADMAIGSLSIVHADGIPPQKQKKEFRCQLTTEEALEDLFYAKRYGVGPCSKLIPRKIAVENKFPVGRIHEDLATTYKYIASTKKIAYGSKEIYYYRMQTNSTTRSKIADEHIDDIFIAMQEAMDYIEKNYPSVIPAAKNRCARNPCDLMHNFLDGTQYDIEKYRFLKGKLRPYYKDVMRDLKADKKIKIEATAMLCGYYPTVMLWKMIGFAKRVKYTG